MEKLSEHTQTGFKAKNQIMELKDYKRVSLTEKILTLATKENYLINFATWYNFDTLPIFLIGY